MINYLRQRLGVKLLLSYLGVMVVGVIVLIIASQFLLPAAFNRHLVGAEGGLGNGLGRGAANAASRLQFFADFRASFNEALMYAIIAAMVVAILLGLFFSRRVVAPVRAMSVATQRIADGQYEERVDVKGDDELAQLAAYFNQMAEKLDQVESMRRRLIGDVSHELRTPLTVIKGSVEGLMDGILPATEETFQQIHNETDRIYHLVDDLQELSRVEARAYQLDIRPLDVSSLIKTVTKRLTPVAESKRISLIFNLPPDLPHVLADEGRAIQIFTNLVGNALKYTPEDGTVDVSAKRLNGDVHLSVHDTGIGIPSEHLKHIFDRFYRVDKSRSRQNGGGSGIGLTIARFLVEAHGGRIWAESAGEGGGSTFNFTLPVTK